MSLEIGKLYEDDTGTYKLDSFHEITCSNKLYYNAEKPYEKYASIKTIKNDGIVVFFKFKDFVERFYKEDEKP